MAMEFQNQKRQRLEHVDLSRKGSVDEPIADLVRFINSLPNYFTTSSCSGRIIVFESGVEDIDENSTMDKQSKIGKKGCKWLYVSHTKVSSDELENSLSKTTACSGNAVFKFEAMVMHIQCQTLEDAQRMHQAAMAAGFRNSGVSIGGKKKIILGVRSTHGLEAPLTKDGRMLVTPAYYGHLVDCANDKMEENFTRINRFFENVKLLTKEGDKSSRTKGNKSKRLGKKEKESVPGDRESRRHLDAVTAISPPSQDCDDHGDSKTEHSFGEECDDRKNEMALFMFEDT